MYKSNKEYYNLHDYVSLFHDYSREQVHSIFAPGTSFTPQAGSWGLHGIIRLKGNPADFVLFVTFGQSASGHSFDEGLDEDGILRWQSQPAQTFRSQSVQELIEHEEDGRKIHLFLRTRSKNKSVTLPYTYLGLLQYAGHDAERERPVHIAWQLRDWPIPTDVLQRINLKLDAAPHLADQRLEVTEPGLTPVMPPEPGAYKLGRTTREFKARQFRRLSSETSKAIGDAGERLALAAEKQRLVNAGRPDLAHRIEHISLTQGDGAGYDIRSYNADGSDRFIEVKTTTGSKGTPFFVSVNEVAFSEHAGAAFVLFRITDLDLTSMRGNFFTLQGPLSEAWELAPNSYLASPKRLK
ncbi:DUF3427 domain-containing protein [Gluconobacter albidus]|uniref:DUF3427 domain-containing protein n=1 Tax=Gluconobacter albidus TaxID=318683 RepID=UPI0034362A7D